VTLNINDVPNNEPDTALAPRPSVAKAPKRRPLADDVLAELTSWQSRLRMAAFRGWAHGDLSIVHLSVLAALEFHGPLSMTNLAEAMGVSVASATGIVTRMEKRGVVRRRHDQADRRVVVVEITTAGTKVSSDMEKNRNERLRTVLDGLTDEELGSFLLGLRALGAARMRLHDAEEAAGRKATAAKDETR
jgi:DNA-binding MarR family transcriptional regulator